MEQPSGSQRVQRKKVGVVCILNGAFGQGVAMLLPKFHQCLLVIKFGMLYSGKVGLKVIPSV